MGEAPAVAPLPIAGLGASPPAATTTSPLLTFAGTRVAGRLNLRQKVADELKNVRVRKSPANKEKILTRSSALPPPPLAPPPLELNHEDANDTDDNDESDAHAIGRGARGGCSLCERSFSVFRAKHTCRLCAQKICDDCSKNRMKLHRRLERKKGSRLCDPCARSYLLAETGSGEDSTADASPVVAGRTQDQDSAAAGAASGAAAAGGGCGLPRRRSVASKSKKLTKTSHVQDPARVIHSNCAGGSAVVQHDGANMGRMLLKTRVIEERRRLYPSHLRTRHWVSLILVAVLVVLRVVFYSRSADIPADARASSRAQLTYSFVERALDKLLSVHTLGTYVLGLVLFDELSRPRNGQGAGKKPHSRRRRRPRRTSANSCDHERERVLSTTGAGGNRCAPDSVAPSMPDTSQDDDLEVTVMEQKFEDESVTVEKLVASLEDGARNRAPDGELSLECFIGTCNVICGFLGVFGRATSFAGSTVGAYFTSIDHNLETWIEPPSSSTSWKEQSVKAVIEHEVGLGMADVGGKKKPSCSRCLLRLLWFIQFVEACVRLTLLDSTEDNCFNGASKAYEETLGKRHPWLVRKGVNTALGSIPTRSHILAELHKGEGEALEVLRKAHAELLRVIAELKTVFEAHGLTDLK